MDPIEIVEESDNEIVEAPATEIVQVSDDDEIIEVSDDDEIGPPPVVIPYAISRLVTLQMKRDRRLGKQIRRMEFQIGELRDDIKNMETTKDLEINVMRGEERRKNILNKNLLGEIARLEKEKRALLDKEKSLVPQAERNEAWLERNAARWGRMEARWERDAARTERDKARKESDALKAEIDKAKAEREALKAEKDALKAELDKLKQ